MPPAILAGCSSLATLSLHGNPLTAEELRETPGWAAFDERRRAKYDKQVGTGEGCPRRVRCGVWAGKNARVASRHRHPYQACQAGVAPWPRQHTVLANTSVQLFAWRITLRSSDRSGRIIVDVGIF